MGDVAGQREVRASAARASDPYERVLTTGLAVAALFHLAGNHSLVEGSARPVALVVMQSVVGVAAMAVLLAPRHRGPVLVLAAAIPVSAWTEAPAVGNHWVLAAATALTYLVAAVVTTARGRASTEVAALAVPAVRLVLLGAYSFAAFAKLNSGFMDPTTSCAVLYQDQLVGSWGLDVLSVQGSEGLGRATAIAAAAVELSVPVLLLVRRSRPWGVLLAMTFHWTLAMDLQQHFWDFSSILFVLSLLFLDRDRLGDAERRREIARSATPSLVRTFLVLVGLLLAVVATAGGALGEPLSLRATAVLAGHLAWWVVGTGTLLVAAAAILASRRQAVEPTRLRPAALVVALVPALVVLNGLTPYLELKTGFSWNMYSNLRTVAGETNHLLVPATWDLTGLQHDRVSIASSTDPTLTSRPDYEPVWSEFVEYAHRHPDETVAYTRGGRAHSAATLADDPATAAPPSQVSLRLQSFRVVDVSGAERCLDSFGPAR